MKALRRLAREKSQILVHIEPLNVQFHSVLAIKGRSLVIARPRKLQRTIPRGSWLRGYHNDLPNSGFRVQIVQPDFLLANGNSVLVTELPSETTGPCRRQAPRHDTSRFDELRLAFPYTGRHYRVTELSATGCRVLVEQGNPLRLLPPDEPIGPAELMIGSKRVPLLHVTPRTYVCESVGLAMELENDGKAPQVLSHFLAKLNEEDSRRYQVNPAV